MRECGGSMIVALGGVESSCFSWVCGFIKHWVLASEVRRRRGRLSVSEIYYNLYVTSPAFRYQILTLLSFHNLISQYPDSKIYDSVVLKDVLDSLQLQPRIEKNVARTDLQ